jgi:hypothetical protein
MPAKFDRCVRKVKASGKVDNPYAICNASLNKGKMKEMKTLDMMKYKIVESLTSRVEEGFAMELGRGLGGAKRIISRGITKTGAAMGRAFTNRMSQPGPEGMKKTLSAARALGKEAGKGMVSGGKKLFSGALKTGRALYRSAKDSMAARNQKSAQGLKFDNPNPQNFSFGRNEDELTQDFRNRRRAFRVLTKPQNLPKVSTTGEIEGDDEEQNIPQNKTSSASTTAAPSKTSAYANIKSVPSPYGSDAEPPGPRQKAINPVTGRQQAKRIKDYLKDIEIEKDREELMGSKAQDSTELFGQKIVERFKKLTDKQKRLDKNKNKKLDGEDFEMLRAGMTEMKVNPMIDRKEVRRMKAAGVSKGARREFTADDVARKTNDAKIKASMGPNNPKNTFKPNPKRNEKYIKSGKKSKPEAPMTKAQIDRSGTEGKSAAGRPGRTKAEVLDQKLAKIDRTSKAFMANLAKNPKNSQK